MSMGIKPLYLFWKFIIRYQYCLSKGRPPNRPLSLCNARPPPIPYAGVRRVHSSGHVSPMATTGRHSAALLWLSPNPMLAEDADGVEHCSAAIVTVRELGSVS